MKEAATYLGFSRNTIYRNAMSGRLRGKRLGRSWRFTKEALDNFLIDHTPERQASRRQFPDDIRRRIAALRAEIDQLRKSR